MLQMSDVIRILTESDTPLLSLYLNVDPGYQENQAANPAWRVYLKNALREIEADFDREQQRVWQPIRERAEAFLANYRPESKGLVLFMSSESQETIALPLTIENRAAFGEPLVTPLFWKLDEYERYLVVLVDQQEARFLTAYLGSVGEQERMEIDLDEYDFREMTISPATSYGKQLNQGSNREAFDAMIDEHRARFYRNVIEKISALAAEHETARIILGGAEETAYSVRNLMPEPLAAQVVDVLSIPLRTPPHEIVTRIQPVAHEHERQYESQLLDGVIDMANSGGRGALGREAVMQALTEQRVEMIIAPWPLNDEELLHTLPARILESSGTIELVHGEAAERLNQEGGIAARLYYTLQV